MSEFIFKMFKYSYCIFYWLQVFCLEILHYLLVAGVVYTGAVIPWYDTVVSSFQHSGLWL